MKNYNALREKLQKKRQSLYDRAGGRGSTLNTKVTSKGLVRLSCG